MVILKKNKLPKLYLFLKGYKIASDVGDVICYKKEIVDKDALNYAMFYRIYIFYKPNGEFSEVVVGTKQFDYTCRDWCYDFWSGELAFKTYGFISARERSLLKYIEYKE